MNIKPLVLLFTFYCGVLSDSYFVKLKDNETFETFYANDLKYPENLRVRDRIKNVSSIGKFKAFVGDFDSNLLARLSKCPHVSEITPDLTVQSFEVQVQEPTSRHLARVSRRKKIKNSLRYYFDDEASGAGVNAYIIDSGIEISHPDFEGRAFEGDDFTNEGTGDTNGHGTHVAGVVGSRTYGVAKNVDIIEVKGLKGAGMGSLSTIIAALDFAAEHRRKTRKPGVANLSLGSKRNSILNDAVEAAIDDGLVVVVAAGNSNVDACSFSPASAEGAITVGSIDDNDDSLSSFSNWGPCVDVLAPGVLIRSLDYQNFKRSKSLSGTSMSAPIVTGIAADLLSRGVPSSQIKSKIIEISTRGEVKRFSMVFRKVPNRIAYIDYELSEIDDEEYDSDDD